LIFGWGRGHIKKKVTIGPRLFWRGALLSKIKKIGLTDGNKVCKEVLPEEVSGIFFTSGSTGVSKGVVYTHGNMHHQVELIRKTFNIRPGEIDMPTFPPFALFNPTYGVSSIIPDMDPTRPADINPQKTVRIIQQFGVNSMFGSPSLIDRMGRYGVSNKVKLPTLKRVFSAGAPVPAKALKRFSRMLKTSTQIFTPYGATEAMPVTCIGSQNILSKEIQSITNKGGGICIGKQMDSIQAKIIYISDEPIVSWSDDLELAEGQVGEIVVKGENVSSEYFNRNTATNLAKIKEGNQIWHRMGDLGYKDSEGRLWFCGRKSHRVKLQDKELYSIQCECIFNIHPQVYRTALVGNEGKAILCVEIDKSNMKPDLKVLENELLEMAQNNKLTRDIRTVLFHPSFPVDIRHNAKIFREKLAVWAANI